MLNNEDDNIELDEEEEEDEELEAEEAGQAPTPSVPAWPGPDTILVETGRGNAVAVAPGSSFIDTVERIAWEHNYGRNFRVYLDGSEVVRPEEAPPSIEPGMRIALTAYDKPG